MESEIEKTSIHSDLFDKIQFQKQLDLIKNASDLAQSKIDWDSAHDDNIIRAIEVVEDFLRKKHRLCYGGQAINAHLPSKYKFYDPKTTVPDYDFFTPQQDQDITALVKDLRKAGFQDITAREGMHEGTTKIYVDYIPVADMTAIDPKLYKILSKRESIFDGISYLDPNSLRMLMYLELSRPRGEVGRWSKVYERLALLNEFAPIKQCKKTKELFQDSLNVEQTQFTMNYIIKNERIFAGADLVDLYEKSFGSKKSMKWILKSAKPILFFSNQSNADAEQICDEFNILNNSKSTSYHVKTLSSKGVDLIPSLKIVCQGKIPLVFIIDETACHSYVTVSLTTKQILKIASMDTLITLYFGLALIDSSYFDMGSMECLANQLVELNMKARFKLNKFAFPFISLDCIGHQSSLPSLIRAKVKRMTNRKAELKSLLKLTNQSNKTIKQKKSNKK